MQEVLNKIVAKLVSIALPTLVVWVLWEPFAVDIFHAPVLTYWQTLMGLFLVSEVGYAWRNFRLHTE